MRITYLAHASLLVEAGGQRLVTDPWLEGPTYLGAWWHFPEPAVDAAQLGPVDWVYLTHEHVDHFHVPTLARLPRATPILIGRFFTPRFVAKLRALGFSDIRELPHGREVPLGPDGALRVTSYQYRADDTALVVRDREATLLDLNDCLLRAGALDELLERHGKIDLLAASFANAEAYPIVYDLEDARERPDWDDQARFDGFLDKVRAIAPDAFVPFASMFCFLSPELRALNERIVSPAGLSARAAGGEVAARPLAMNPGDRWTPAGGHEVRNPVDWARKAEILDEYAARRAPELAAQAATEVVPGGRAALAAAFEQFFRGFVERLAWPLRRKLDLALRFDIDGAAGQTRWLRFAKGRLDLTPPRSDDAWDARITIGDWPLWRALTQAEMWQSLGISCRFRVALRPGVREREVLFWFLLYLDDLGYVQPWPLLAPRALGVLLRRRRELGEYANKLVRGTFVDESLRGKFAAQ